MWSGSLGECGVRVTITSNSISTLLALPIESLSFPRSFTLSIRLCVNIVRCLLSASVRTIAHLAFERHVPSIGNKIHIRWTVYLFMYTFTGCDYVHLFACLVYLFALSLEVGVFPLSLSLSLSVSPWIWYSVLSLLLRPLLLLSFILIILFYLASHCRIAMAVQWSISLPIPYIQRT